ncbi:hypothetical protein DOY81_013881 [Sarcophaga bullata]|nr:hypothetical protein DOY81_013881 [Sarcophaga bullata]
MPLSYWLNVKMEHYCIYIGGIKFLNTPSKSYWMDFSEPIEITLEILTEFQLLETSDGKPLMNKYQAKLNDFVTNGIICNAEPYRNSSDRFNSILALIIMTQLVATYTAVSPYNYRKKSISPWISVSIHNKFDE